MNTSIVLDLIGATITATGLIVTIALFAMQQRKMWLLNSAGMTMALAEKFVSREMIEHRRDFFLEFEKQAEPQETQLAKCAYVLVFFENIGYLVRRGILDKEMIWNSFGWTIERYYILLTIKVNYLDYMRKKEGNHHLIYSEFEWLYNEMIKIEEKNGIFNFSKKALTEDYCNALIQDLRASETHFFDKS